MAGTVRPVPRLGARRRGRSGGGGVVDFRPQSGQFSTIPQAPRWRHHLPREHSVCAILHARRGRAAPRSSRHCQPFGLGFDPMLHLLVVDLVIEPPFPLQWIHHAMALAWLEGGHACPTRTRLRCISVRSRCRSRWCRSWSSAICCARSGSQPMATPPRLRPKPEEPVAPAPASPDGAGAP